MLGHPRSEEIAWSKALPPPWFLAAKGSDVNSAAEQLAEYQKRLLCANSDRNLPLPGGVPGGFVNEAPLATGGRPVIGLEEWEQMTGCLCREELPVKRHVLNHYGVGSGGAAAAANAVNADAGDAEPQVAAGENAAVAAAQQGSPPAPLSARRGLAAQTSTKVAGRMCVGLHPLNAVAAEATAEPARSPAAVKVHTVHAAMLPCDEERHVNIRESPRILNRDKIRYANAAGMTEARKRNGSAKKRLNDLLKLQNVSATRIAASDQHASRSFGVVPGSNLRVV